jgi:hypothetical protein
MRLSKPNYGISRIDQPDKRNHGWFVRITLKGVVQSKFFADKTWGGKNAALDGARDHRDALVKRLPKERQESLARRRKGVKKSGVTGVTHILTKDQHGTSYEYWQAAWKDKEGRRHTAKFSVGEHGGKKALYLAKRHLTEQSGGGNTRKAGRTVRRAN